MRPTSPAHESTTDGHDQHASFASAIGRGARLGAIAGFSLAAVIVTLLGVAMDAGVGRAVAMGMFVGVWSGCGFGAMLGATLSLLGGHDPDTTHRSAADRPRMDEP